MKLDELHRKLDKCLVGYENYPDHVESYRTIPIFVSGWLGNVSLNNVFNR